jgi:prepilin-type processing-associated H-X9-DG protein
VDRPDVRGRNTVFQCPSFRWSNPEHFDHASPKSLKWNALLDSSGRPDRYAWGQAPDEHEIVLFIDAIAGETGMGQWGHAYPSAVDGSRHRGRVHILFLDGHGIGYEAEPDDGDWEAALRWTSRAWQ